MASSQKLEYVLTVTTTLGRSQEHRYPLSNNREEALDRVREVARSVVQALAGKSNLPLVLLQNPITLYRTTHIVSVSPHFRGPEAQIEPIEQAAMGFLAYER